MINKVWAFFIIVGIIFCLVTSNASTLNNQIFGSAKTAFNLIVELFPIMAIWLGIMNIAKESGLLNKLSSFFTPFLGKLFPSIPKGHESLSFISSNIIINMFGLGSAATPFGLKAMKSLQELNPDKDVATDAMITFLVINTSGVTIIPTTIISLRMLYGSKDPTEIVLACILATLCSTIGGLVLDYLIRRKNYAK